MPYMEPITPFRIGDYSRMHNLLPWRPNAGFENTEVVPL